MSCDSRSLNDVLECAEDYAIDIPKIWDYLGELLAPIVTQSTLNLSLLQNVPLSLVSWSTLVTGDSTPLCAVG